VTEVSEDDWQNSSWEDRHDLMTWTVLPNMARLFQRFEGSADPTMSCGTCHGKDYEAVAYKMPHGLPALDPAHLPDENAKDAKVARVAKFMTSEVTPQMADLLGVPLLDPKTAKGFSCFNCHPRQR
jgi:hypothetical protein